MPIDRAQAEPALLRAFAEGGWKLRLKIFAGTWQFTRPAIPPFLPHRVVAVTVRLKDPELEAADDLDALVAAKLAEAEAEHLGLERRINLRRLGLLPLDPDVLPECPE